ncbi:thioredoxin domain-containing protein [Desulforhabdus amnigena]|jgi:protein-disulfide isomerase|uniref:Thioredoxin domain-containing protein n=1 Tax=Desulforhabdus amnigena TaxID=40218 RepID=A0A9W6D4T6_9BACT|nr:thioredoxin domain-containing protein [Desulforhabdus amnigena]GLI33206.1 hypothetical protein DAMNIGENAA_06390 [Desulforhabdus amnigena]
MVLGLKKENLLLALSILGLIVAAVAGLAEYVQWIGALCSGFSTGCKETAQFTLLGLPLWIWGVGYYLSLLLLLFFKVRGAIFWWVAPAIGVEFSLVWIMYSISALCVFCLANLLVVLLILVVFLEKERLWQTLAVSLLAFLISVFVITKENQTMASPMTKMEDHESGIAAVVKGQAITNRELENPLAFKILDLEKQIYKLKRDRLNDMITEMLLEGEAHKKGISIQELIDDAILSKPIEVSDDEVEKFYIENRARWPEWDGSEEDLKKQIKASLTRQKAYDKAKKFAWSLASKDDVIVYLKEPQLPNADVSIGDNMSDGPADAPVTIVEFSDYECPVCRKTHVLTKEIKEMYKGKIRWVFKDFPLRQHQWASLAAEAARCAGEQGKFWEYQDRLYSSDKELTVEQLSFIAKDLGMKPEPFAACLSNGKYRNEVEKDRQEGKVNGVSTTPTYVINGKFVPGAPTLEQFKEMIEAELAKTKPKS